MTEEDRKWLEQLIRENKRSDNELTYTYCPFRVLYALQQERNNYKELYEKENKNQKEFIKFLEEEKNRLARECSQIYEDSLGKTKLVNEDIFNEVNVILSKYKDLERL